MRQLANRGSLRYGVWQFSLRPAELHVNDILGTDHGAAALASSYSAYVHSTVLHTLPSESESLNGITSAQCSLDIWYVHTVVLAACFSVLTKFYDIIVSAATCCTCLLPESGETPSIDTPMYMFRSSSLPSRPDEVLSFYFIYQIRRFSSIDVKMCTKASYEGAMDESILHIWCIVHSSLFGQLVDRFRLLDCSFFSSFSLTVSCIHHHHHFHHHNVKL